MINTRNNSVTSRHAFTLAELLVAIGATAILTVGIGRIVASINTIVVQGGALEEVQASARAIEQLMRKDFELLNQMNADETYIAIRSREMGTPDRPIYRDEEDKRADRRANVTPYDEGSLAIYSRLDEIVFIAGGSDHTTFTSKQNNGFYTGSIFTSPNSQASKARIYYGHGLKPKPYDPLAPTGDPYAQWPDRDPAKRYPQKIDALRIPPRIPEPDGFFGDQPKTTNDPSLTRLTSISTLFGRNEFANSWALARQPLLLDGSAAFGSSEQRPTPSGPLGGAIIAREPGARLISGKTQGLAPTLLDRESFSRWWLTKAVTDFPDPWELGPGQGVSPKFDFWQMPVPRLLRHGATDVVAQTNIEFRDWIEGDAPPNPAGGWNPSTKGDVPNISNNTNKPRHGIAYQNGGWLSNTAPLSNQEYPLYGSSGITFTNDLLDLAQSPLWSWGPKDQNATPDLVRIKNNIKHMRTALAGSIVRPIVEPQAKLIDRVYEIDNLDQDPGWHGFMDNHAVIAAHCSNFEVAWSDGSFAKREIDIDNNGITDYFPGDIIWFDISRVDKNDPNDPNSKRQTMNFYAQNFANRDISWAQSGTDAPKLLDQFIQTNFRYERVNPEIDQPILPGNATNIGLVGVETSIPTAPVTTLRYNPELTGGLPSSVVLGDGSNGVSIDMAEYLTIWPFRKLSRVQDDINNGKDPALSAWQKPSLVRIRLTLHDSGGILKKGKQYEFVFNVNLRYP